MTPLALSTTTAARMLAISPRALQRDIAALTPDINGDRWLHGSICVWRGGRGWRISRAGLEAWCARTPT